MANLRVQRTGAAFVLFDGGLFDRVPDGWFVESFWREKNLVTAERPGRGSVLFVRHADETWVLRHYRRGGLMARLNEDYYLWAGLERTRAFREWRLLDELSRRGLPVPRPIAAHVIKKGLSYRADILTACIENTRSYASMISSGDVGDGHWENIGRTLRRFHDEGVNHHDLNAHNILIDDRQRVFLVDFDRGGLRDRGAWTQSNINRLLRSLRKISLETGVAFDEAGWSRLVSSYESAR